MIDTRTNGIVASIDVGQTTTAMAVNPAGTRVYGANVESMVVIDTATNSVVARTQYGFEPDLYPGVVPGDGSVGVAVSPSGTEIYLVDDWHHGVAIVSAETNTVIGRVTPTSYNAAAIALSPDGKYIYETADYDDTVLVVDAAARLVIATILIDNPFMVPPESAGNFSAYPSGIVVNPTGTRAYVANLFLSDQAGGEDHMSVIDTATNTIIANVPIGQSLPIGTPMSIAMNPQGTRVYLSNGAVIDPATNQLVGTMLPSGFGMAINSDGSRLFALQQAPSQVLVFDTETNELLTRIPVDGTPYALAHIDGVPPVNDLNVPDTGN
ncbi:MAG TPA: YncE family protein [Casimicrobiaceae bacterium]